MTKDEILEALRRLVDAAECLDQQEVWSDDFFSRAVDEAVAVLKAEGKRR